MQKGKFYTFHLKDRRVVVGKVIGIAGAFGVLIENRPVFPFGMPILFEHLIKHEPYFNEEDEDGCV